MRSTQSLINECNALLVERYSISLSNPATLGELDAVIRDVCAKYRLPKRRELYDILRKSAVVCR